MEQCKERERIRKRTEGDGYEETGFGTGKVTELRGQDEEQNRGRTGFGTHCTENRIYIFQEMKLRGLVSQFLHSCEYLYIPRIGLPIWLQQNWHTDPGNI